MNLSGLVCLCLLACTLPGCSPSSERPGRHPVPIVVSMPDGERSSLYTRSNDYSNWTVLTPRKTAGESGHTYSIPVLEFEKPIRIISGNHSFYLVYDVQTDRDDAMLELFADGGSLFKAVRLPSGGNRFFRINIRMEAGAVITGFRITAVGRGNVTVLETGIADVEYLARLTADIVEFSDTVHIFDPATAGPASFSISLPRGDGSESSAHGGFAVTIGAPAGRSEAGSLIDDPSIVFTDDPAGTTAGFSISLKPLSSTYNFPTGVIGFMPEHLQFSSGTVLNEVQISLLPDLTRGLRRTQYDPAIVPIPADPGVMMLYAPAFWRNTRFELFAWESFPGILVFAFSDYVIQSKFFGRLGFFTAVTGEAGRIEEESYYTGRHTYNAHDYRPLDLAAFFVTAERSGIQLNQEETFLRDLCIRNGILVHDGDTLVPGSGAVLSFSHETEPRNLRKRLLKHEAAHGLFYTVESYRERCFTLWDSLPEYAQEFFTVFLENKGRLDGRTGYAGYDIHNRLLLVNEFQAHIIQLEKTEVENYFRSYLRRMELVFKHQNEFILKTSDDGTLFGRIRLELEYALEDTTGIKKADLYTISRLPER